MADWEGLNPPYATIVADPPWAYDKINPDAPAWTDHAGHSSSGAFGRGAGLSYSSMDLAEIRGLQVADVAADDARLYLWVTNRYLRRGWDVMEAWGFTPQDRVLVWCKPPRGTTPVTTEFVLIGKKGKPAKMPWHGTTWFQWPHQAAHSVKPDAFMDLVESWSPGPYVELFARQPRLGWDSWGYGYEVQTFRDAFDAAVESREEDESGE